MILRLEKLTTSAPIKVQKKAMGKTQSDSTRTDIPMETGLMALARLRVAQILGCKSCMRDYADELKKTGETDARLRQLANWRRETAFSLREKAALNLAEAVTCNPIRSIPGDAIGAAHAFFTEEQLILFVLEIVAMNDWHYLKTFRNRNMRSRPPHE